MIKWMAPLFRITVVRGQVPRFYQLVQYRWEEIQIDPVAWFEDKNQLGKEVKTNVTYEYWMGEPDPVIDEETAVIFEETRVADPDMSKSINGRLKSKEKS